MRGIGPSALSLGKPWNTCTHPLDNIGTRACTIIPDQAIRWTDIMGLVKAEGTLHPHIMPATLREGMCMVARSAVRVKDTSVHMVPKTAVGNRSTETVHTAMQIVHTGMKIVRTGMKIVRTGMQIVSMDMQIVHTGMQIVSTDMQIVRTGMQIVSTGMMQIVHPGMQIVSTGMMQIVHPGMPIMITEGMVT